MDKADYAALTTVPVLPQTNLAEDLIAQKQMLESQRISIDEALGTAQRAQINLALQTVMDTKPRKPMLSKSASLAQLNQATESNEQKLAKMRAAVDRFTSRKLNNPQKKSSSIKSGDKELDESVAKLQETKEKIAQNLKRLDQLQYPSKIPGGRNLSRTQSLVIRNIKKPNIQNIFERGLLTSSCIGEMRSTPMQQGRSLNSGDEQEIPSTSESTFNSLTVSDIGIVREKPSVAPLDESQIQKSEVSSNSEASQKNNDVLNETRPPSGETKVAKQEAQALRLPQCFQNKRIVTFALYVLFLFGVAYAFYCKHRVVPIKENKYHL